MPRHPVPPGLAVAPVTDAMSDQEVAVAARFFQPVLNELAAVIGARQALRLAELYGGKCAYVPARVDAIEGAQITSIVGREAALRLQREYAGVLIEVPHGPFSARAQLRIKGIALAQEGRSTANIASELRVNRSTVKVWKSHAKHIDQASARGPR